MSSRHDLQRQAALWIRRLNEADPAGTVQADFIHWCRQSPRHVRALLEISRLREELGHLDEHVPAHDVEALAGRLQDNARYVAICRPDTTRLRLRSRLTQAGTQPLALQGTPRTARISRLLQITLVAVSTLMVGLLTRSTLESRHPEYSTPAGESRSVILKDNTQVRLGPNTRLVTRFERHQRLIEFSGGEAMFHVSPDTARPFLVRTDMLTARAVGTVFAVSRHQEGSVAVASVTVASGKVEVRTATSPTSARLAASEQAVLHAGQPLQVNRVDLRDELSWVDNRLVFYQGATLATAAQQFNRRNRLQIIITDPILANRPVMGTFRASDPQAFLGHFAPRVPFSIQLEPPDQARLIPL